MLTTVDEIAEQCGMLGLVILAGQESDPHPAKPHDILTMV